MFDKLPKLSPKIETPTPTTGVTFDAERFNKEMIIMPRSTDAKANAAWMTEAYRKLRSGEILTIQLGRGTQIVLINGKDKIIRASEEVRGSDEAPKIEQVEITPNLESIKAAFIELVKEKSYETTKLKEDAHGPYLWEIKINEPDGSIVEYIYSREGTFPEVQGSATKIEILLSDETGFPCGGYDAGNYVNGKWEFRKE